MSSTKIFCGILALSLAVNSLPRVEGSGYIGGGAQVNSAALDTAFGSTQGQYLERGSAWGAIGPLTAHGVVLGEGASPFALVAPVASGSVLASAGATSDPAMLTVGKLLDELGATPGSIVYRGTTTAGYRVLVPDTDGKVLTLSSGVPVWGAASSLSLAQVLANGFATGGHNISMSNGDSITAPSGSNITLGTNPGGNGEITLNTYSSGTIGLSAGGSASINYDSSNGGGNFVISRTGTTQVTLDSGILSLASGMNITFAAGDSIQTSGTDALYVEGTPISSSGGAADAVMVVDDTRAGSGQGHGGGIVLTIHNATYSYLGGSPQVTLKCWKETGTVNDAATFGVATSNGGFSDDSIKFAIDSLGYVRSAISVVHGWTNSATDATPGTALDTGISRDSSSGAGFLDFGNGAPNDKTATLGFSAASMGGKITKYAAVATAAQGVGAIVAQNSRAAQTASDASLVTFTPAADGSYLISPNLTVTATAVGLSASVAYTDQNSVSRTQTLAFLNAAGSFVNAITATGSYEGASVRIRVKGGNAITVSTTITSGTFDEDCDIQWVK